MTIADFSIRRFKHVCVDGSQEKSRFVAHILFWKIKAGRRFVRLRVNVSNRHRSFIIATGFLAGYSVIMLIEKRCFTVLLKEMRHCRQGESGNINSVSEKLAGATLLLAARNDIPFIIYSFPKKKLGAFLSVL